MGWIMLAVVLIILVLGIQIAIAVAIIAGLYVLLHWAYTDDKFDFAMAITMQTTMILIVWIADSLSFIGWNLVVVWVVIQFGVIVRRGILENI